jgi:acylphosphatase
LVAEWWVGIISYLLLYNIYQVSGMMRCRIIVSGLVQGIGFRSFTKKRADETGVSGFVRNLPDKRLEIVVEGYAYNINRFIDRIKEGPWGSRIEKTEMRWESPKAEFKGFEIKV